jgi:hypothetical protein
MSENNIEERMRAEEEERQRQCEEDQRKIKLRQKEEEDAKAKLRKEFPPDPNSLCSTVRSLGGKPCSGVKFMKVCNCKMPDNLK